MTMTDDDVISANPADVFKVAERTVVEIDGVNRKVRINGTDVGLIAEGGVKIGIDQNDGNLSADGIVTVTLVLMPHEVQIRSLLAE